MLGGCNICYGYMVYLISGYIPIHTDMYIKGVVRMIKDRSHTISCVAWACHLYPVAVGALPTVWGVTYRNYKLLLLLKFILI